MIIFYSNAQSYTNSLRDADLTVRGTGGPSIHTIQWVIVQLCWAFLAQLGVSYPLIMPLRRIAIHQAAESLALPPVVS
jgi:hypothetical protein